MSGQDKKYSVALEESGWSTMSGGVPQPASKEDFLTALSNLEHVLLRASVTEDTQEASLK